MTSVSAIIPTYNGRAFIGRALDSVLAQTRVPDDIAVVDDASSDGTADFVAQRYPQVKLVRLECNVGSGAARNAGIAATAGEIIAFLDQDDAWEPDYVTAQREMLLDHPKAVLSRTAFIAIDEKSGETSGYPVESLGTRSQIIEHLLFARPTILTLSIVAVPRRAMDTIGGFDPSLRLMNDRDLYIRLALKGGFAGVNQALCTKYMHGHNALFMNHGKTWLSEHELILDRFFANPANKRFLMLEPTARAEARARIGGAVAAQSSRLNQQSRRVSVDQSDHQ